MDIHWRYHHEVYPELDPDAAQPAAGTPGDHYLQPEKFRTSTCAEALEQTYSPCLPNHMNDKEQA